MPAPLPPLRRKILRSYLWIAVAYVLALAAPVSVAIFADQKISPKLIYRNYESIRASHAMLGAWDRLQAPGSQRSAAAVPLREAFSAGLQHEFGFVTEPGEQDLALHLQSLWKDFEAQGPSPVLKGSMEAALQKLIRINESGMLRRAALAKHLGRLVVGALIAFLALALFLAFATALRLGRGLSDPLVQIAKRLEQGHGQDQPLALPEADSAELEVLRHQVELWWDEARAAHRLDLAEIVAQRDKLEALLASMEDAVLLLDSDGRVAQVNERLAGLLGQDQSSATGRLWAELAPLSDNGRRLLAVQGQGEAILDLGLGDKRRAFAMRSRVMADLGTLVLLQDVTERRQRERLEGEFLAVLSHELKTPLQSLGTAADLLDAKRQLLDPSLHPIIDIVMDDLRRIRGMANEFMQVSQLSVRSMRLKVEGLRLDERLPEWARPFELIAAEKGVRLQLDLAGIQGVRTQADPVKFSWVVSNLLSNAVRVSPQGGLVLLSANDREGRTEITVQDQGPGVPAELQARLFEPFFQAEPGPGSKTAGLLGLGLTVAKEIVEAHGGSVSYRRGPEGGSIFSVLIPHARVLATSRGAA